MKFSIRTSKMKSKKILLSHYELRYLKDKNTIKILFEENQRLKSSLETNEDLNIKVKKLIDENQRLKSMLETKEEELNINNEGFFLNFLFLKFYSNSYLKK